MATYIALIDYTEQGIRNIKEAPHRADAFREAAKSVGVTVKDLYWTTGGHDGLLIIEAPDDATVARLTLSLAGMGNVRTHTLRAFDASEMRSIVDKL